MKFLIPAVTLALMAGCAGLGGGGAKTDAAQADAGPAKAKGPWEAKVQVDREKNLDDDEGFFVPTCIVRVPLEGKVSVHKQGSALQAMARGGNANTVKASAKFKVVGLDKETVQSAAKAACDDFVAKVRASGFKVVTWDDVKGQEWAAKIPLSAPKESGFVMDGDDIIGAPSDAQNFKPGLGNSYNAALMSWGKPLYKEKLTLVIPSYNLAAPQIWGATDEGYNRISAAINAAPGMTMTSAFAPINTAGGGWGGFKTKSYYLVAEKVGELAKEDTTSTAANTFSKTLGFLSGAGSITGKSASYIMTVDKAAYKAAVLSGAAKFNDEVGKTLTGLKKS